MFNFSIFFSWKDKQCIEDNHWCKIHMSSSIFMGIEIWFLMVIPKKKVDKKTCSLRSNHISFTLVEWKWPIRWAQFLVVLFIAEQKSSNQTNIFLAFPSINEVNGEYTWVKWNLCASISMYTVHCTLCESIGAAYAYISMNWTFRVDVWAWFFILEISIEFSFTILLFYINILEISWWKLSKMCFIHEWIDLIKFE